MFFSNLKYTFKSKPLIVFVLLICMIALYVVACTAYGVLKSAMNFYGKPQTLRYIIYPKDSMTSSTIDLPDNLTDATEQVFIVSTANRKNSTVFVGVYSHDSWMPSNDVDVFVSTDDAIENLAQSEKVVWLSTGYYQLYENIDPWIKTININHEEYSVAGMADYYFSEDPYDRLVELTAGTPLSLDMELPQPKDEYNSAYDFPNIVATVMMSGSDFTTLNVPIAYIEVVFEESPSYEQYLQMKQYFDSEFFDVGDYITASNFSSTTIDIIVCLVAFLFAVILINSLVRFVLNSQSDVWRSLHLLGAQKALLVRHMMGILAIIYFIAAGIAAVPSYFILKPMAEMNVSVPVDWATLAWMVCLCAVVTLFVSLPVCRSCARRHSREEGAYVQTI